MPNTIKNIASGACHVGAAAQFDPDSDSDTGPVPSPCIQVCRISAVTGWCEGCQRRLEEIGLWGGMSEDDKRAVWRRIHARRAQEKITHETH
ncbi:MAG: DUF1289 domain-containing protein [Burkholderiales bacterium]|nr:DUF1289 domain-containing protein [Burkholderiales bacterium]